MIVAAWPRAVSSQITGEIHNVLTTARGDVLTVGAVFAIYFASSGVESLRIGLNRAYGLIEPRPWWLLRLESIGYVLVSAVGLLALAFLVVLGPLVFQHGAGLCALARRRREPLQYRPLRGCDASCWRSSLTHSAHVAAGGRRQIETFGPASSRRSRCGSPAAIVFGRYLSDFSYTYVTYYAGLASAMMALVFLYFIAWIFIYGGELNAAIARVRTQPDRAESSAASSCVRSSPRR